MITLDCKSNECKHTFENVVCPFEKEADQATLLGKPTCFGRDCFYFEPVDSLKSVEVSNLTHNPVEHPSHYCQGGIECIKAIEAAMPPEGFQDYCKGNVLKYIWRWRDKAGVEDLKKAKVYLEWLIESAEKKCNAV